MKRDKTAEARLTLTVSEAAAALGVGRNTLYEALARGDAPIAAIKVGKRVVVSRTELENLLAKSSVGPSKNDLM